MRNNSIRVLAAAAVLSLAATKVPAAEPDYFEQLRAARQAIGAMQVVQLRLKDAPTGRPELAAAADASGQGDVSSENIAVTQNPGSYWYYADAPVAGDLTLDGPAGARGTIHLTGRIYVTGSGWGGTGPGSGSGTVTGDALLTDARGKRYAIPVSVDVEVVGQAVNGRISVRGPVSVALNVGDSAASGAAKSVEKKAGGDAGTCLLESVEGRSCVYRCGGGRRLESPVQMQEPIAPGSAAHPYCAQLVRLL
jgi:hypothetical protein